MHDEHESTSIDGNTKTNLKVLIQQEGLPTDVNCLRNFFNRYHEELGMTHDQVKHDLETYRCFVNSKYISRLQKSREEQNIIPNNKSPLKAPRFICHNRSGMRTKINKFFLPFQHTRYNGQSTEWLF